MRENVPGNHWRDWVLISGLGFTATAVGVCCAWIIGDKIFFALTMVALLTFGFIFTFGVVRYIRTRSRLRLLCQLEMEKNQKKALASSE